MYWGSEKLKNFYRCPSCALIQVSLTSEPQTIIVSILLLLEWWLWRKNLFLQEATKLLPDVGGKKSILMKIKKRSNYFSVVSGLNKTLAHSGLSWYICEMILHVLLCQVHEGSTVLQRDTIYTPSPPFLFFSICFSRHWPQKKICITRKPFPRLIKNSAISKKKMGEIFNSTFLAALDQDTIPK